MDHLSQSGYEIQFYGMSLDKINSVIKEELCGIFLNNVDQFYATIKEKWEDMNEDTYKKFLSEKENVKKKIISKIELPIKNFQARLYKSFQIPDNILLPEDEMYANSLDDNFVEELNLKISNLEKEIFKIKYKLKEISLKQQQIENLNKYVEDLKVSIMNTSIKEEDNKIGIDLYASLMNLKQSSTVLMGISDQISQQNH